MKTISELFVNSPPQKNYLPRGAIGGYFKWSPLILSIEKVMAI